MKKSAEVAPDVAALELSNNQGENIPPGVPERRVIDN